MKKISKIITLIFVLFNSQSFSQGSIQHMLGYVEMTEACIWVQTETTSKVVVELFSKVKDEPNRKFYGATSGEYAQTAHIKIFGLEPGTSYHYRIYYSDHLLDDDTLFTLTTQPLWQYRTEPPEFTVATGSCAYVNEKAFDRPGDPYGGGYDIFKKIAEKKPEVMLWLGDNIYLREVDFSSQAAVAHRYNHCRSLPELQPLLQSCANYAIWDDHDFGPNDANGSYIHKDWTLDAFRNYWANPSYGLPGACGDNGITTQFSWGDIDFFLLDNRYHRVAHDVKNGKSPTILGEEQIDWLISSLKFSKSPFKIIAMGGQFLNTDHSFENYVNWTEERQKILTAISDNNISGVVFLTGDRHCGEMSELKLASGQMVYEITVSPLTSKAYDISKEINENRIAGSIVAERHFATLKFSGIRNKRVLTINVMDAQGILKFEKIIPQPKTE